jgi:hypothetical protein
MLSDQKTRQSFFLPAGASYGHSRMDVTRYGVSGYRRLWMMSKNEGFFDPRLVKTGHVPLERRVPGSAIMVAPDVQDLQFGMTCTPGFYLTDNLGTAARLGMYEIAEQNQATRARAFNTHAQPLEIGLGCSPRHGDSEIPVGGGLAEVHVCNHQRLPTQPKKGPLRKQYNVLASKLNDKISGHRNSLRSFFHLLSPL